MKSGTKLIMLVGLGIFLCVGGILTTVFGGSTTNKGELVGFLIILLSPMLFFMGGMLLFDFINFIKKGSVGGVLSGFLNSNSHPNPFVGCESDFPLNPFDSGGELIFWIFVALVMGISIYILFYSGFLLWPVAMFLLFLYFKFLIWFSSFMANLVFTIIGCVFSAAKWGVSYILFHIGSLFFFVVKLVFSGAKVVLGWVWAPLFSGFCCLFKNCKYYYFYMLKSMKACFVWVLGGYFKPGSSFYSSFCSGVVFIGSGIKSFLKSGVTPLSETFIFIVLYTLTNTAMFFLLDVSGVSEYVWEWYLSGEIDSSTFYGLVFFIPFLYVSNKMFKYSVWVVSFFTSEGLNWFISIFKSVFASISSMVSKFVCSVESDFHSVNKKVFTSKKTNSSFNFSSLFSSESYYGFWGVSSILSEVESNFLCWVVVMTLFVFLISILFLCGWMIFLLFKLLAWVSSKPLPALAIDFLKDCLMTAYDGKPKEGWDDMEEMSKKAWESLDGTFYSVFNYIGILFSKMLLVYLGPLIVIASMVTFFPMCAISTPWYIYLDYMKPILFGPRFKSRTEKAILSFKSVAGWVGFVSSFLFWVAMFSWLMYSLMWVSMISLALVFLIVIPWVFFVYGFLFDSLKKNYLYGDSAIQFLKFIIASLFAAFSFEWHLEDKYKLKSSFGIVLSVYVFPKFLYVFSFLKKLLFFLLIGLGVIFGVFNLIVFSAGLGLLVVLLLSLGMMGFDLMLGFFVHHKMLVSIFNLFFDLFFVGEDWEIGGICIGVFLIYFIYGALSLIPYALDFLYSFSLWALPLGMNFMYSMWVVLHFFLSFFLVVATPKMLFVMLINAPTSTIFGSNLLCRALYYVMMFLLVLTFVAIQCVLVSHFRLLCRKHAYFLGASWKKPGKNSKWCIKFVPFTSMDQVLSPYSWDKVFSGNKWSLLSSVGYIFCTILGLLWIVGVFVYTYYW